MPLIWNVEEVCVARKGLITGGEGDDFFAKWLPRPRSLEAHQQVLKAPESIRSSRGRDYDSSAVGRTGGLVVFCESYNPVVWSSGVSSCLPSSSWRSSGSWWSSSNKLKLDPLASLRCSWVQVSASGLLRSREVRLWFLSCSIVSVWSLNSGAEYSEVVIMEI